MRVAFARTHALHHVPAAKPSFRVPLCSGQSGIPRFYLDEYGFPVPKRTTTCHLEVVPDPRASHVVAFLFVLRAYLALSAFALGGVLSNVALSTPATISHDMVHMPVV